MSNLREAAQQALEALEGWDNYGKWVWPESALEQAKRNTTEAIPALRAALEQEQAEPVQEPVAFRLLSDDEIQAEWSQTPQDDKAEGLWFGRRIEGLVRSIALAQEQAEPVAWMCPDDPERETAFHWQAGHCDTCGKQRIPLYTAPPQRKPLTEEEEE